MVRMVIVNMKKVFIFLLCIIIFTFSGCTIKSSKYINKDLEHSEEVTKKIMQCFDDRNIEDLEKMFSKKTKSNFDIPSQIQAAFNLYNGKSLSYELHFGDGPAGGWIDGEWVDKHLYPEIGDIKTDANDIYSILYWEYLVYEKDKSMVGIECMSLHDKDNNTLAEIGDFS